VDKKKVKIEIKNKIHPTGIPKIKINLKKIFFYSEYSSQ
jgi:hypothetical protein